MVKVIQRLDPLSCAKITGLVYGLFALILFPLMIFSASANPQGKEQPPAWIFLILMIIYPLLAFVMGGVGAWAYNLCAGWIGGIKIELNDE